MRAVRLEASFDVLRRQDALATVQLACAWAMARFIAHLLYGVTPMDAATLLGIAASLAAVALVACYLPARRATRIDPMVCLRHE